MKYSVWYQNKLTKDWTQYTSTNNYYDVIMHIAILRTALGDSYFVKYFEKSA